MSLCHYGRLYVRQAINDLSLSYERRHHIFTSRAAPRITPWTVRVGMIVRRGQCIYAITAVGRMTITLNSSCVIGWSPRWRQYRRDGIGCEVLCE